MLENVMPKGGGRSKWMAYAKVQTSQLGKPIFRRPNKREETGLEKVKKRTMDTNLVTAPLCDLFPIMQKMCLEVVVSEILLIC